MYAINIDSWNPMLIRVCVAVWSYSNKGYEALQQTGLFILPHVRTLISYVSVRTNRIGSNDELQNSLYQQWQLQREVFKKANPDADVPDLPTGMLVFDEIVIRCGLVYNSKNGKLVGYAIDEHKMASLADVFEMLTKDNYVDENESKMSKYILQFMYRPFIGSHDYMGPYYTSHVNIDTRRLHVFVIEAMKFFNDIGFDVDMLICDGAKPNLSLFLLLGDIVENRSIAKQSWRMNPFFINPFTGRNCYFMFDPSHLVKNCRNALYMSRPNAKDHRYMFQNHCMFWTHIDELYAREKSRSSLGQLTMTRVCKNAVSLTSHLKMRVGLALRIFDKRVWSELDTQNHSNCYTGTMFYLKQMRKIFIEGLLSHERVYSMESPIIRNIQEARGELLSWEKEYETNKVSNNQSWSEANVNFISFVTWQQLRITINTFLLFSESFFANNDNKGAYIIPQRFNQSPLESYFGHVRQTSGGSQAVTEAMYSAKHRKIGTLSALKGKGSMNVSGAVSQLVTSNSAFTPTRHR